ncbi:MAG: hypothetical protein AAF433_22005 [Bacteroidota bacterium]
MLSLLKEIDHRVRTRFSIGDIGLLKTYGALPGLVLGAFFPEFVLQNLWIWIALFLLIAFRFLYLLLYPKQKQEALA